MMPIGEEFPPDVPEHWMVYFAVDDTDAACDRIGELGGEVSVPSFDVEGVGRIAVVNDAHGAVLSVITIAPV